MRCITTITAMTCALGQGGYAVEAWTYEKTSLDTEVVSEEKEWVTADHFEAIMRHFHRCPEGKVVLVASATFTAPKNTQADVVERLGEVQAAKKNDGPAGPGPRNYQVPLSPAERADINYIVRTLAEKSTPMLVFYKSSLNEAGSRIDRVHPLRFLEGVFTERGNKKRMQIIRNKSWVWDSFMDGLKQSLHEERALNNLTDEIIRDFAENVQVEAGRISPLIHQKRWENLVITLIKSVPA